MTNALAVKEATQPSQFSQEDLDLIRRTVAKDATPQEFELFLHRAKSMRLNPLKPGEIYFVKYGNNPGTIIVGVQGFRSLAGRSGKHAGTKRGVIKDQNGKVTGAWAEVYRSDWQHPAREEVSMSEYNKGKSQWASMPETMLKKCAECAALRMAFPEEVGGVYGEDERDVIEASSEVPKARQIEPTEVKPEFQEVIIEDTKAEVTEVVEYVFKTGASRKGKKISDFTKERLNKFLDDCHKIFDPTEAVLADRDAVIEFLSLDKG